MGVPQKWLVYFMENPTKLDDLGVPLFQETPILCEETQKNATYTASIYTYSNIGEISDIKSDIIRCLEEILFISVFLTSITNCVCCSLNVASSYFAWAIYRPWLIHMAKNGTTRPANAFHAVYMPSNLEVMVRHSSQNVICQ